MTRDPVDRIEAAVTLDARTPPSPARLDALLDDVMSRLDAPVTAEVIPLRRAPSTRWRAGLALVAAAATAAAAVAVTRARRPHSPPHAVVAPMVPTETRAVVPAPVVAPTPAVAPMETPAVAPMETREVPSAAGMYRAANEARHRRDDEAAMRGYEQLIRVHPRSRESVQARVTLGRMLLDRHERLARAAALAEEALAAGARSSDAETAMGLRAQAYRALGRGADERRAWEALLARFPDSLLAATARARLDALR